MSSVETPWIVVAGGFHDLGGMDRLNAAFVRYLTSRGTRVHLIGHDVDPAFAALPGVTVTCVRRPFGSFIAGEMRLAHVAARVRWTMARNGRAPILLGNGGNVANADINWVHSVHHAWRCADEGAPTWFRAKNRAFKAWSKQRESGAIAGATAVIANSRRTSEDLLTHLPRLDPNRIQVIYPGTDPAWRPPDAAERARARALWCQDASRPLIAMVGALGHDVNKGVDVLLRAWRRIAGGGNWDPALVVAGPGDTSRWRQRSNGLDVRFTGHIDDVGTLLDAADLVVSPVRYEAYGLAVHEAICRGVPVLVSRTAGIVERFIGGLEDLLLDAGNDEQLAARLLAWRANMQAWRELVQPLGAVLRADTLDEMCARIVAKGAR